MKIFLLFIMMGLLIIASCTQKENVVAMVGDVKITDAEVSRILNRKMKLLGQAGVTSQDRQETLNEVINRKLLYLEGVRLGIKPSEAQLKAEVEKTMAKFVDENTFKEALKREGLDMAGFRKEAEEYLVVKKVEERLTEGVLIDEAEAKRYYEEHKGDYLILPKYRIYLVQAEGGVDAYRLLGQVQKSPADFDHLALEQGTPELRTINRNAVLTPKSDFPDEMFPALERLKRGEIGGPVKTKRGYFLFRLIEKTDGFRKSWDEARVDIFHLLTQEKRQAVVGHWQAEQREKVKVQIL